jgi:hypothetical protein
MKYHKYLYTLRPPQIIQQLSTGRPILARTKHCHSTNIIHKSY